MKSPRTALFSSAPLSVLSVATAGAVASGDEACRTYLGLRNADIGKLFENNKAPEPSSPPISSST